MNKLSRILLLAIALVSTLVLQSGACTQSNEEQTRDVYVEPTKPVPVAVRAYKLGDVVDLGDRRITVFGFQPHSEAMMKEVYGSPRGQAMDVLIENVGSSPFHLSPLHFTVQDADGRAFSYYDVTPGGKRPRVETEEVAPRQKIRAYITYANVEKPAVIYYKSLDRKMAKIVVP